MPDERQIREWRKYHQQSLKAMPGNIAFVLMMCGVLWIINFFVPVPGWVAAFLIGIAGFGAVGDALNILYLRRKLRSVDEREP